MELRENTFNGLKHEDANEHIDKIFKLADLFKIENMTFDRLMLTIFPLSLWGDARRWLNNEPMESITNWSELQAWFLGKFGPIEHNPKFICWLKSKFRNPDKMSISLKNELWTYWKKGNDDKELNEEVAELFRIETNLFEYETPLCKEFKEFNYLFIY